VFAQRAHQKGGAVWAVPYVAEGRIALGPLKAVFAVKKDASWRGPGRRVRVNAHVWTEPGCSSAIETSEEDSSKELIADKGAPRAHQGWAGEKTRNESCRGLCLNAERDRSPGEAATS
jgi:hypothetical protein